MIRIICGTCGTSKGYKTAADGELTLPAAEEKRLVARGVAEYVTQPIMSSTSDADSPVGGGDGGGTGIHPPNEGPPLTRLETPPAEDTSLEEGSGEIPEYSADMKADQLRALLERYDVPYKSGMSKADMVAALDEYFAQDGSEAPPELSAEAPVV